MQKAIKLKVFKTQGLRDYGAAELHFPLIQCPDCSAVLSRMRTGGNWISSGPKQRVIKW